MRAAPQRGAMYAMLDLRATGLSGLEYAVDAPTTWKPLTGAVAAPDLEQHVVYVRATDAAGNVSTPTATTIPRSPDAPMTGNVARYATASASSASGWAPVGNANDGSTATNPSLLAVKAALGA